jgi:hypothetical protein
MKHISHIGYLANTPATNVLVKGLCVKKHMTHISHITNIPIDIGNWDISSLTNATDMFNSTSMTLNNMDGTLRGWAKLDTAAGESAIQSNVTWSIANYTDATARQYLIDTYHWTISGGSFDGSKTIHEFVVVLPIVKSVMVSLPAFLKP